MGLFEKILATAGIFLLVTMPIALPLASVRRWRIWRVAVVWAVALLVTLTTFVAYAVFRVLVMLWAPQ